MASTSCSGGSVQPPGRTTRRASGHDKFNLRKGSVSLADELHHVGRYVETENERRLSSIVLLSSVPGPCLALQLPKITPQPIVENAVLHGIAKKSDSKGAVFVSVRRRDNSIIVTIRDDGVGMTPERLREVLSADQTAAEVGYGIQSVRERLKMLYGSAADLCVESEAGAVPTRSSSRPHNGHAVKGQMPFGRESVDGRRLVKN